MPAWLPHVVEQLWSFLAVALAVNALGSVSKRVADRFGWRRYRRRDVVRLLAATKGDVPSSDDIVLPADASWYDITLRLHPLVVGACFGLFDLPTLDVIAAFAKEPDAGPNALLMARCAWFMLAGALSGQLYEAVKFAFTEGRTRLLGLIGIRPSSTTPATSEKVLVVRDDNTDPTPKNDDISSGNEDR